MIDRSDFRLSQMAGSVPCSLSEAKGRWDYQCYFINRDLRFCEMDARQRAFHSGFVVNFCITVRGGG